MKNVIKEKELPTNLKDYAWTGRLPLKTWEKYKDIVIYFYIGVIFLGVAIGAGTYFVFNNVNFPVWLTGAIFIMWGGIAFPLIYKWFLVTDTYIIEPSKSGEYILKKVLWFKRDHGKYSLSEALFDGDKGLKRTLWWRKDDDKYISFNPDADVKVSKQYVGDLDVDIIEEHKNPPPSTADLAGMPSWRSTVKVYSHQKSLSMQQVIQYSIFAIIIAIEIIGIFMLGNRDDAPKSNDVSPQVEIVKNND